jgi:hypothetical protein
VLKGLEMALAVSACGLVALHIQAIPGRELAKKAA